MLIIFFSIGLAGWADEVDEVVRVRIEGESETLFDGEVVIEGCEIFDEAGGEHEYEAVAACAVEEAARAAGIETGWQDFGFGLLLAQVGEIRNADDWSKSWGFWVDYDPAQVGLSDYELTAGEEILVAYTGWPGAPLRVTGPDSVEIGDEVELAVEQRGGEYDELFNWTGRWEKAAGLLINVDGQDFVSDEEGKVREFNLKAGDSTVRAEGEGNMIRSREWVLMVWPKSLVTPNPTPVLTPSPVVTSTPTAAPDPALDVTPTPAPEVLGVSKISDEETRGAAARALSYLRSKQDDLGGIDGAMVSGWAAMALGADGIRASEVKAGGKSLADYLAVVEMTRITDKERQIMALRAAGINPRDWRGRDLAGELLSDLEGNMGVDEFINDEVFGGLALMAAETAVDEVVVRELVSYVISEQEDGGGWGTIDMTAAAIQMVQAYRGRGGSVESEVLYKARAYLREQQEKSGGWGGNSATTAWVMMAIKAMGENQNDWVSSGGMVPGKALLTYQASSGGFGWQSNSGESAFMTAYAVPALLGKVWPITSLSVETDVVETDEFYVEEIAGVILTPHPSPLPFQGRGDTRVVAGQVAGVSDFAQVGNEFGQEQAVEEEVTAVTQPEKVETEPMVPIRKTDRGFLWLMFGLANAGIGGTITRLVMKIL